MMVRQTGSWQYAIDLGEQCIDVHVAWRVDDQIVVRAPRPQLVRDAIVERHDIYAALLQCRRDGSSGDSHSDHHHALHQSTDPGIERKSA